MKIVIIEDNKKYAEALFEKLKQQKFCEDKIIYNDVDDLGKFVAAIKIDKADLILLNCELKVKDNSNKRQDFNGIEILKWLRLKEINNHCIVYSFITNTKIIKMNPLNSILHSRGVTFVQAPFLISEITMVDRKEIAENDNLVPFFRAEIDLIKIRHELANFWGLHRLGELLGININTLNESLNYEALKYLTPAINKNKTDNTKLKKAIKEFNPTRRKIFYFDDMADKWGPVLEQLFGKENFNWRTPQNTPKEELFILIDKIKPECVLLDLRLKNEKEVKNVIEYSGGKLLLELKRRYGSLPVIMFTATNKAESVRQLLASGAEYVWSKEGVDDGINNELTLRNTLTLMQEVQKCLSKFENSTYKYIYETECELQNLKNYDNGILSTIRQGFFRHVKTIIIDSNYLISGIEQGYLPQLYKFLISNHALEENKELQNTVINGRLIAKRKMKVVIHSDVLNELYIISSKDETIAKSDRNNSYRVPVARFLLNVLYKWKKEKLIYIDMADGHLDIMDEIASVTIPETPNLPSLDEVNVERKSFFARVAELFQEKQQSYVQELNEQINQINKTINDYKTNVGELPDFSKLKLHADDTFQSVIPKYLNNGGVVFVADDKTCVYNVGLKFENDNYSEQRKRDYRTSEDKKNGVKANEKQGVFYCKKTVNEYFNIYQHLFGDEFNNKIFPNTP